jgi:hypothetical protein
MANKFFKILYIFILAVITLAGTSLILLSFYQFNFLSNILNLKVEILIRLRLAGIAIILLAFFMLVYSKKIITYFTKIYFLFLDSLRKTPKPELFALILVLAISILVRLLLINRPITYPEAYSFMNYYQKSLSTGISTYSIYNQPLNSIILHIFYVIFGNTVWVLRIPAFISGFTLVFLTYVAGSVFYSKKTGLVAAGFIAILPVTVDFSVNMTGYSIFAVMVILLFLLAKNFKDSYRLGINITLISFSVLGLYMTPVMIYPILIIMVWLAFTALFENKKQNKSIIFVRISGYFLSAIIIYFILSTKVGLSNILSENFSVPSAGVKISKVFTEAFPLKLDFYGFFILIIFGILFLAGLIFYIMYYKKIEGSRFPIILPLGILMMIFILFIKNGIGLNFMLTILPILIIIFSSGLVYALNLIFARFRKTEFLLIPVFSVIIIVFFAVSIFSTGFFSYDKNKEIISDAENITEFLKEHLKTGDMVLANNPADYIFKYYFFKESIPDSYLLSYLKPSTNLYVIVDKNFESSAEDSLVNSKKSYLLSANLNKPNLIKAYNSADIYLMNNLNLKDKVILDYRTLAAGSYMNMELSDDGRSIIVEGDKPIKPAIKSCSIPVKVVAGKSYLITFDIMMTKDLTLAIKFYFNSASYNNNPDNTVEWILAPVDIGREFKKMEKLIDIGHISNPGDVMSFNIDTKGYGEVIIRNLEIYEVDS